MLQLYNTQIFNDLKDELFCLQFSVISCNGNKHTREYKKIKSKLKRMYEEVLTIKTKDEAARKFIIDRIRELYYSLREKSTKQPLEATTYFTNIEENILKTNEKGNDNFTDSDNNNEDEKGAKTETFNQELTVIEDKLTKVKENFLIFDQTIISTELEICKNLLEKLQPCNAKEEHRLNTIRDTYNMLLSKIKREDNPKPIPAKRVSKVQFKEEGSTEATEDKSDSQSKIFDQNFSFIENKLLSFKNSTTTISNGYYEEIKKLIDDLQPTNSKESTLKQLLYEELPKLLRKQSFKRQKGVLFTCRAEVDELKKILDGFKKDDYEERKRELDGLLKRISAAETKGNNERDMQMSLENDVNVLIHKIEVMKNRVD